MIDTANINGKIQKLGFKFVRACACAGRIRTFARHPYTIKHFQSSRFVRLYDGRIEKLFVTYEQFEKLVEFLNPPTDDLSDKGSA